MRTLQEKVSRGEKARQIISDVGPRLKQIEDQYLAELLQAARNDEPTDKKVYRLLAVADLGIALQTDVDTGRSAAKKLHEQTLQAAQQGERWTEQKG